MNTASTVSTEKKRKTDIGEPDTKNDGNTGTFVYLKTRAGMKSESTHNVTREWRPKMWTYLR